MLRNKKPWGPQMIPAWLVLRHAIQLLSKKKPFYMSQESSELK